MKKSFAIILLVGLVATTYAGDVCVGSIHGKEAKFTYSGSHFDLWVNDKNQHRRRTSGECSWRKCGEYDNTMNLEHVIYNPKKSTATVVFRPEPNRKFILKCLNAPSTKLYATISKKRWALKEITLRDVKCVYSMGRDEPRPTWACDFKSNVFPKGISKRKQKRFGKLAGLLSDAGVNDMGATGHARMTVEKVSCLAKAGKVIGCAADKRDLSKGLYSKLYKTKWVDKELALENVNCVHQMRDDDARPRWQECLFTSNNGQTLIHGRNAKTLATLLEGIGAEATGGLGTSRIVLDKVTCRAKYERKLDRCSVK